MPAAHASLDADYDAGPNAYSYGNDGRDGDTNGNADPGASANVHGHPSPWADADAVSCLSGKRTRVARAAPLTGSGSF